jgi:hypothetical protein
VRLSQVTKDEKKRIKALERDLNRKEKALAEAAALFSEKKPRRSGGQFAPRRQPRFSAACHRLPPGAGCQRRSGSVRSAQTTFFSAAKK